MKVSIAVDVQKMRRVSVRVPAAATPAASVMVDDGAKLNEAVVSCMPIPSQPVFWQVPPTVIVTVVLETLSATVELVKSTIVPSPVT
jgi:hypothetical protein